MGNSSSKKKTAPAQNINMTDASQVGQTELLQAIAQSMQGMSTAIQELSKNVKTINTSNVERDKILKRLDDNDKQKDDVAKTTARIATANNITDPNRKADLKEMIEENNREFVYPLKNKVETLENENSVFRSTFTTITPKTTQTIRSGTSCKEGEIEYIDMQIQDKENLLNKKTQEVESYISEQTTLKEEKSNIRFPLTIEVAKLQNEMKGFDTLDKLSKEKKYNTKIERLENQISNLDKEISECDNEISNTNKGFRKFSKQINLEITEFKQKRQEVSDRYIMSEEEFQKIIEPLKGINLTGLGHTNQNTLG